MKPIIEVRNLSKIYQIGAKSERYISLRDRLSSPSQWFRTNKTEPFYALKDVSFDIMPGETVGIIGRNGAGKSTLLKILSRITPPTSGSIKLRGRVASLLEVGTGFHPELTGRENIYFNGAILGMRKSEINQKLDEIVDFSGVEQFLDTPLKQYSSGMQLRLAFAVAAHLEPEILLIDEVLAVGDAEFQKKCLGKMEDISKGQGRTVVVVSHDMGMVGRLCESCLLLDSGHIVSKDYSNSIIDKYFNITEMHSIIYSKVNSLFFSNIIFRDNNIVIGQSISLFFILKNSLDFSKMIFNINIHNVKYELMCHLIQRDDCLSFSKIVSNEIEVKIFNINFPVGKYFLSYWIGYDMYECIERSDFFTSFTVTNDYTFINRSELMPSSAKIIIQSNWNYSHTNC